MSELSKQLLFWTPRVLSIIFIAFLSLFALDVFDGHHSFWQTMLAFIIHQIPVFVLIAALILAWRWEWIGAALYAAAALLYVVWIVSMSRPVPPVMRLIWILMIAVPAFVIAGLFLANWLKHGDLRALKHQGAFVGAEAPTHMLAIFAVRLTHLTQNPGRC